MDKGVCGGGECATLVELRLKEAPAQRPPGEPALSDLIVLPAFADFSGVKTHESPMDINRKSFEIMVNC